MKINNKKTFVNKGTSAWLLAGTFALGARSTSPANARVGAGAAAGHEIGKRIR